MPAHPAPSLEAAPESAAAPWQPGRRPAHLLVHLNAPHHAWLLVGALRLVLHLDHIALLALDAVGVLQERGRGEEMCGRVSRQAGQPQRCRAGACGGVRQRLLRAATARVQRPPELPHHTRCSLALLLNHLVGTHLIRVEPRVLV